MHAEREKRQRRVHANRKIDMEKDRDLCMEIERNRDVCMQMEREGWVHVDGGRWRKMEMGACR